MVVARDNSQVSIQQVVALVIEDRIVSREDLEELGDRFVDLDCVLA